MNELITFNDLKELAKSNGIADNKISVGMWAKFNGFIKDRRIIKDNRIIWTYKKANNNEQTN